MQSQRAIIYTRVSTGRQADEGTSLETQEAACLRLAKQKNAQIVDIIPDEGVSGALYLSRPGIQKAIGMIESGEANLLITMKLDRSGRNVDALRLIRKRVLEAGGELLFADGMNFEDTAIGNLMFTQIAGFAEYEKEIIRERTMNGRRRRAEEGQQPSRSRSPYGYHVVTKEDVLKAEQPSSMLGQYVLVEEQAAIVRRIFARYASGASLLAISRELQSDGVPPPRGGKYWRKCTIQRLLLNPVYKGTPAFGRYRARTDEERAREGKSVSYIVPAPESDYVYLEAPPLVDADTFAFCSERLKSGRTERTGNPERVHLLAGILRCPQCGGRMRGKWTNRRTKSGKTHADHYYQCKEAYPCTHAGSPSCHSKSYPASEIETAALAGVRFVARSPEAVPVIVEAYRSLPDVPNTNEERNRLQKALRTLEAKEKATIEAQIAGIMAGASASSYAGIIADIAKEREAVQVRLRNLEATSLPCVREEAASSLLASFCADLEEALTAPELNDGERRKLLTAVIASVTPEEREGDKGVQMKLHPFPKHVDKEGLNYIVSMISTLARGTITVRPS